MNNFGYTIAIRFNVFGKRRKLILHRSPVSTAQTHRKHIFISTQNSSHVIIRSWNIEKMFVTTKQNYRPWPINKFIINSKIFINTIWIKKLLIDRNCLISQPKITFPFATDCFVLIPKFHKMFFGNFFLFLGWSGKCFIIHFLMG